MAELSAKVSDLQQWQARHDGSCEEFKRGRREFEKRTDDSISGVHDDLEQLGRDVQMNRLLIAKWSGGGSLTGALLGALATALIKHFWPG